MAEPFSVRHRGDGRTLAYFWDQEDAIKYASTVAGESTITPVAIFDADGQRTSWRVVHDTAASGPSCSVQHD